MLARYRVLAVAVGITVAAPLFGQQAFADPNVDVPCSNWGCQLGVTVPGQSAVPPPPPRPRPPAAAPRPAAGGPPGPAPPPSTRPQLPPVLPIGAGGALGGVDPALRQALDAAGTPPAGAARGAGGVPAAPPPAVIAQRAISHLDLTAPPIRLSPPPASHGATIGFPVWMWLEPGQQSTGPISASATAGGVTVTATARLQYVVWDMGDGTTLRCDGPGTPFTVDQAGSRSPDCGHVYTMASPALTVTATSVWHVTWQGGGAAGQATLQPVGTVQLPVREIRTLNTTGGT